MAKPTVALYVADVMGDVVTEQVRETDWLYDDIGEPQFTSTDGRGAWLVDESRLAGSPSLELQRLVEAGRMRRYPSRTSPDGLPGWREASPGTRAR